MRAEPSDGWRSRSAVVMAGPGPGPGPGPLVGRQIRRPFVVVTGE